MASVHSFGNRIKSDDDAICSGPLPGRDPHAYAIFVDERDIVWLSEWSANALARFDPRSGKFDVLALPRAHANVRQMMAPAGAKSGCPNRARIICCAIGIGSDPLTHSDKRVGHFLNVTRQTGMFQPSVGVP